jgi:hypothetical protein
MDGAASVQAATREADVTVVGVELEWTPSMLIVSLAQVKVRLVEVLAGLGIAV